MAWKARRTAELAFRRRVSNTLLRHMAANAIAIEVLILGVYIVLKVSGLTRLAVTVLGVIFPQGVPVRRWPAEDDEQPGPRQTPPRSAAAPVVREGSSSAAEGGLESESGAIEAQARQSRPVGPGENLLNPQEE